VFYLIVMMVCASSSLSSPAPSPDFTANPLVVVVIGGIIAAGATLFGIYLTNRQQFKRDQRAYQQQIEREQAAYARSLKDAKRERLRNSYEVLLNAADKYQYEAQQITHMPDAMNISLDGIDEAVNEISEEDDTDVLPIFFALRGAFNDFAVKFSAHIGTGEEILKHQDTVLEKFEELKTAMKKHLKELES
jgi:uncharacterized protein HemX